MLLGAIASPLLFIGAASAQGSASDGSVAANLNGPCFVSGTIEGAGGYDPSASGGVYTVPIAGSASYAGGIEISNVPDEGRPISGSVSVALPLGISVQIKNWSDEDSTKTTDAGSVTWDLPDATPRGIELTVSGNHNDLSNCDGSMVVKLEGGLLDSTTGLITLALTVITGGLMAFAGLPK
ncbi:MAG: hypothetical protein O3A10_12515 [Chloroflexi bacterium]|nr:hypothetical protein [Chloroflexota bacterium]